MCKDVKYLGDCFTTMTDMSAKSAADSTYMPTSDELSCTFDFLDASGVMGEEAAANWYDMEMGKGDSLGFEAVGDAEMTYG